MEIGRPTIPCGSPNVWFRSSFVSKIKDVAYDLEGALKLSVSLFDTSDPEHDVLVDKELVDAGKAVYLCV